MSGANGSNLLSGPFSIEGPFWDALGRAELRFPQCEGCGRWNWPPVPRCPACGSFDHAWQQVGATGTLYSWTTIHRASTSELAGDVPFVVVLVEVPQAGNARIMGRFEGNPDRLSLGVALVGSFRPATARTKNMPTLVWSVATAGASS
ncbi:MAG: Zn-ribbon domain-containing OB-fold protein [Desertimonas sp.]